MYYYNPEIYKPEPILTDITQVPTNKYEMYSKITKEPFAPYPDKKSALNSRWTGRCRFWEDGEMYEADHIAVNAWLPVQSGEVQTHMGINWDTYFARDKDVLMNHLNRRYDTIFGAEPRYDKQTGLWSIQVHYDGRCR